MTNDKNGLKIKLKSYIDKDYISKKINKLEIRKERKKPKFGDQETKFGDQERNDLRL